MITLIPNSITFMTLIQLILKKLMIKISKLFRLQLISKFHLNKKVQKKEKLHLALLISRKVTLLISLHYF